MNDDNDGGGDDDDDATENCFTCVIQCNQMNNVFMCWDFGLNAAKK